MPEFRICVFLLDPGYFFCRIRIQQISVRIQTIWQTDIRWKNVTTEPDIWYRLPGCLFWHDNKGCGSECEIRRKKYWFLILFFWSGSDFIHRFKSLWIRIYWTKVKQLQWFLIERFQNTIRRNPDILRGPDLDLVFLYGRINSNSNSNNNHAVVISNEPWM